MPAHALVQGASRGLGLGFVHALLARGHHVIATCRDPAGATALQTLRAEHPTRLTTLRLDVEDEPSIEAAAAAAAGLTYGLDLLLNVAGLLHADGLKPEKRLAQLDPAALTRLFAVNAIGPALVVKHLRPLLIHGRRAVVANLSARVGSIGDNRLGGWYGYRASKAAQNQLTRTMALELGRRSKATITVALHPGTVATELSAPFTARRPADRIFPVERAVRQLLTVIDGLTPDDNGRFIAWDGSPIEW